MEYRRFGRTNLNVSLVSLGTGGPKWLGQNLGVPEEDSRRLIHQALDLGINLFDTAPAYYESEAILGRALQFVPRDRYLISTKASLVVDAQGETLATPEEIIESVETSLRRMKLSEIDLLLVGGFVSAETYDQIINELYPVLLKLQREGKVRFLGATEKSSDDGAHEWLRLCLEDDLFDVVMVAYNMINQSAEHTVFPLCRQHDVGVMNIYSVRRVFSDPVRIKEVIAELVDMGLIEPDMLPSDDPLGWLVDDDVKSVIEAAYRFVAGHPAISTIMTGTINIQHLAENVEIVQLPSLSKEKITRLKNVFGNIAEPIGN